MLTHATALRLKAANFPQPGFQKGQRWYDPAERLLLACSLDGNPTASRPFRFLDLDNPDDGFSPDVDEACAQAWLHINREK